MYVDDILEGTINQYSAARAWQAEWASGDLGAGEHTVRFEHASGSTVDIDAIEVKTYEPPPPAGIGKYDDTHAGWAYSGSWNIFTGSGPYQGGIHYSTTPGSSSAEFAFEGSQIILVYTGYFNRGTMDVYVDDVLEDTINQYSPTRMWQAEWASGDLGAGEHTVRFEHASGATVDIDAIEVKTYEPPPPPPGIGKYDDTHAGWVYSGSWNIFTGSGPYQGGIHYSTTTGNTAEFTFEGSQIILVYTGYYNRGTMEVYVDDVLEGTINQYSATRAWQAEWASGDLGAGEHTVKLFACQWLDRGY